MALLIKNNAYSTITGAINDAATSLTVASTGDGDKFPIATMGTGSTGDYFYATLVDNSNNIEIIKVRTRASGSATMSDIQRGQDGSTATSWDANDRIELRPVAALFSTYIQADGTVANATNAVLADESSDTTCFPTFATAATGNQPLKTGSNLTFNSDTGALGATSFTGIGAVPTGSVFPYAGTSAPTGYLFCFGQTVSRSTYSDLFSALSTTYGAGDGSSTFVLPDLRGRAVAGKDDMGGSSANNLTDFAGGLNGDTLGDTGGSEKHVTTIAELPSGYIFTNNVPSQRADNYGNMNYNPLVPNYDSAYQAGSGTAHNNVQPTIILNYIIKT